MLKIAMLTLQIEPYAIMLPVASRIISFFLIFFLLDTLAYSRIISRLSRMKTSFLLLSQLHIFAEWLDACTFIGDRTVKDWIAGGLPPSLGDYAEAEKWSQEPSLMILPYHRRSSRNVYFAPSRPEHREWNSICRNKLQEQIAECCKELRSKVLQQAYSWIILASQPIQ